MSDEPKGQITPSVICRRCKSALATSIDPDQSIVEIEPCEKCLDEAATEGRAEGLDAGVEAQQICEAISRAEEVRARQTSAFLCKDCRSRLKVDCIGETCIIFPCVECSLKNATCGFDEGYREGYLDGIATED